MQLLHVTVLGSIFFSLTRNKKTKCQIIVIIIFRPVFIMLCAVRARDEMHTAVLYHVNSHILFLLTFPLYSLAYTVCLCVPYRTVSGICSHSLSPFHLFHPTRSLSSPIFRFAHVMRSSNPHNNNPAAMNPTLYAWMLGIILCDACLPFRNHYYCTANTSTNARPRARTTQFIIFNHFFPF